MSVTKIATCCYCGTKAALVLRGKDRHELACGNCGAPLHALKVMPGTAKPEQSAPKRKKHKPAEKRSKAAAPRPQKRRKRKSFGQRVFAEIWDVIEDVVDDVFD